MTVCEICHELDGGMMDNICNVCMAKMYAIIHCKTLEEAEELVRAFLKYPTSRSALI